MVGSSIAHYKVTAKLGEGGMGEVYRATDSKLGRDVALKVLPEAFAQDAQRMQRFQREAQVLASLNHPNIATIHGLEESGGVRALVMELVEGPTLAERIASGAIPLDEALPIAKQIADALEYAHEHGIIHRDLKPANIKLTTDGHVKVLDFGLAKALADESAVQDISTSPTLSMAATKAGVILGTAAYMSPEQARGGGVDRRADVWAFGVVLFEMLSGKRMFDEQTASDTLAAVLKSDLDLARLPAAVPPGIRRLIARCLERDRKRRLQAIGEARIALEEAIEHPQAEEAIADTHREAVTPLPAWRRAIPYALTVAFTAAASFLLLTAKGPATEAPLRKTSILTEGLRTGVQTPPAISPNGRLILYVANGSLWVRPLDQTKSRELTGKINPEYPLWSPDSSQIAYLADRKLWKVSVAGGAPVVIAPATFGRGATTPGGVWTPDGKIVFAPSTSGSGLLGVSADGGDFAEFMPRDERTEGDFHKPSLLPGGKGLLFVIDHNEGGPDTIGIFSSGVRKTVLQVKGEGLDSPVYSPSGHLLYRRDLTNPGIWAVPFSLASLQTTGEPFLVAPEGSWPSVSEDGTLLYSSQVDVQQQGVLLDRRGQVVAQVGQPDPYFLEPRFSPDGTRIAVGQDGGIFIHDIKRKTRFRLTFDEARTYNPTWSAGGDRLIYARRKGAGLPQLFSRPADGSGAAELLVTEGYDPDASADGKWLVYSSFRQGLGFDLFYVSWGGERKPQLFSDAPEALRGPAFSPDGRFVAYVSIDSGGPGIYVKPFPAGEGKWQVSAGGTNPIWNRLSNRLFYVQQGVLMEVEVTTKPAFSLGKPRPVFSNPNIRVDRFFDASPNGQTFVMAQDVADSKAVTPSLTLVQNWFAEFKAKHQQ